MLFSSFLFFLSFLLCIYVEIALVFGTNLKMSFHSFFLFISLAFPELQIQNMSKAFETLSRIGLELLEDPNCGASALKNFLQKEHKTKGTVLKVGFLLSVHIEHVDNAKS